MTEVASFCQPLLLNQVSLQKNNHLKYSNHFHVDDMSGDFDDMLGDIDDMWGDIDDMCGDINDISGYIDDMLGGIDDMLGGVIDFRTTCTNMFVTTCTLVF